MRYIIKEYRVQQGMTIKELAEKVGISRVYLSMIESGKADNISSKVLVNIASALGKKVDDLIDDKKFYSDC